MDEEEKGRDDMPLETSDEAARANEQPRLAAAEKDDLALASRRMNGLYNESDTVAIPAQQPPMAHILSYERYGWHATLIVLTVVANLFAHLFATGWLSGIARDSDLQTFKVQAADKTAVIDAKVDRVNEKVDRFIDANRKDHEIIGADLKEVMKTAARIEGFVTTRAVVQPVVTAPAAQAPVPAIVEPTKEKTKASAKRPKQPAAVQAPSSGGFFSWAR